MIPRETAAAIIGCLEGALVHLLKAGVVVDYADTEDPIRVQMGELWLPTATTAGLLAAINSAHPDLAGPDVAFRDPSVKTDVRRLSETDMRRIRVGLSEALQLLGQVTAILRAAESIEIVEKERLVSRSMESTRAISAMLERLAE